METSLLRAKATLIVLNGGGQLRVQRSQSRCDYTSSWSSRGGHFSSHAQWIAVYTRLAFASSTSSWLTAVARDEASEAQSCSLPPELQIYHA